MWIWVNTSFLAWHSSFKLSVDVMSHLGCLFWFSSPKDMNHFSVRFCKVPPIMLWGGPDSSNLPWCLTTLSAAGSTHVLTVMFLFPLSPNLFLIHHWIIWKQPSFTTSLRWDAVASTTLLSTNSTLINYVTTRVNLRTKITLATVTAFINSTL